jgi:hypothetical protein
VESIIDVTRTALNGNVLERLSVQIRESPAATRRGIEQAVPISIAGLASHAATQPKAEALLGTLRRGNYPHTDAAEFARSATNADHTARLAMSGNSFLTQIFGDKLSGIIDLLARQSGVSTGSAATLLGVSAPMVLHAVGKEASERNLDARGLSQFLADQGDRAKEVLPGPLSSRIAAAGPVTSRAESFGEGMRGRVDDFRRRHHHDEAGGERDRFAADRTVRGDLRAREPRRRSWPWIALAVALLVLLALLLARRGQAPDAIGRAADRAAQETKEAAAKTAEGAEEAAGKAAGTAERAGEEAKHAAGEIAGEAKDGAPPR